MKRRGARYCHAVATGSCREVGARAPSRAATRSSAADPSRTVRCVSDRRLAVIDLGSNSFRLVVFTWGEHGGHGWWRRTDEIHEAVRVGAGLDAAGELQPEPMERALETIELFAHFCRATGIDDVRPVATSAIRDATNQEDFLAAARERSGLEIEVLSPRGGGALRLPRGGQLDDARRRRRARPRRRLAAAQPACGSAQALRHALVAARRGAHDRALPARRQGQGQAAQGAAGAPADELGSAAWLAERRARWPGIGGTVRNLAAAAELRGGQAVVRRPGLPARARARSTTSSSASRTCRRRSAARSRASSPSAAT